MTYNGYIGAVEYDDNARTFSGRVINANVLISFRGDSVRELEASFHSVVEAYLEDCRESGVEPEKPYNGTLTVRVDPEVHRKVALKALEKRVSMNRYVEGLLRNDLGEGSAARIVASRRGLGKVATRAKSGLKEKKPKQVLRRGSRTV